MTTEEHVVAILRQLPPERQAEVLDFVEFLKERTPRARSPRPYRLCAGEFQVPDDFDAPVSEHERT